MFIHNHQSYLKYGQKNLCYLLFTREFSQDPGLSKVFAFGTFLLKEMSPRNLIYTTGNDGATQLKLELGLAPLWLLLGNLRL